MKKKRLGIQVMPISPMVRAWAMSVCLFDEEKPEWQQSKSCSVQTLVDELVRRSTAEDVQCEKLKQGIFFFDRLHDVPFLSYGCLHSLVSILGMFGEVSLIPASAGGMLVEVLLDSGSSDLFESLYGAE